MSFLGCTLFQSSLSYSQLTDDRDFESLQNDKILKNHEMLCRGGHYIIPQSQFWHQATQLSTTNEHFISDLDFPNSHYIFIHFEKSSELYFPKQPKV